MIIELDGTGSPEGPCAGLCSVSGCAMVKGILVFDSEDFGFSPEAIDWILRDIVPPLIGGIILGIIAVRKRLAVVALVVGFEHPAQVGVVRRLSNLQADCTQAIESLIPRAGDAGTMFVILDGSAKRISGLIERLFNGLGLGFNCIGCGAGHINPAKLDQTQRSFLLSNRALVADSALFALMQQSSSVAVGHGWRLNMGPYRVTESEKNVVKTLDWWPAFEVCWGGGRRLLQESPLRRELLRHRQGIPFRRGQVRRGAGAAAA